MNQDPFTHVVGGIFVIAGLFFMAYWMNAFINQNGRPGKWLVWFFIGLGGIGMVSLLISIMG